MQRRPLTISTRARRLTATVSLATLAGAVLAAPAVAAEDCVLEVSDATEYLAALECASDAESAVTITLLADFAVPHSAFPQYSADHDLTIDGNGHTVTATTDGGPSDVVRGLFLVAATNDASFPSNDVTITNVTIQGFEPDLGVVAMLGTGTLTISNSTFANNVSTAQGEGVFGGVATVISTGSLAVENSTFANNVNNTAGAVTVEPFGVLDEDIPPGALDNAALTVTNSTFIGNETLDEGGAISSAVPVTVTGSTFAGNAADDGAAIRSRDGLVVSTSSFVENTADLATIFNSGELTVQASTFSDNYSDEDATIYTQADSGSVLVENSTFTNNANDSGALVIWSTADLETTVRNSTFADNDGSVAHLRVRLEEDATSSLTVDRTVFTSHDQSPACSFETSSFSSSDNFDPDGSCTNDWAGEGDFGDGVDPLLGELADNGGPTQTLLPLDGSPLIDAIPTTADALVTSDQRGISRPQGLGYDIGAVEVEVATDDEDDEGNDSDDGGTGSDDEGNGSDTEDSPGGPVDFQVKTDGGTLLGTVSPAVAVTDINWTATSELTGAPVDTALPYGAAGFTVEVFEPGQSVTVTLTAPTPFTSAYKVSGDTWTEIPGATFSADGTTVTYTLTDGGDLDEDGEANGFIVDPVALAVQASFTG